jgi:hypothetical protein
MKPARDVGHRKTVFSFLLVITYQLLTEEWVLLAATNTL